MRGKPLLYDVFSGAGGCTHGYQLAGFEVLGVDLEPQPRYCGETFIQMDAFQFFELVRLGEYPQPDAWHCSPPCQAYANVTRWTGSQASHDALIEPVRELLEATGRPYVIENVVTPEIRSDWLICGTTVGLPIRRHRFFETNWSGFVMSSPCQHRPTDLAFDHSQERAYADAMGCQWMTAREARQAIPPAYTRLIGEALAAHIATEVPA